MSLRFAWGLLAPLGFLPGLEACTPLGLQAGSPGASLSRSPGPGRPSASPVASVIARPSVGLSGEGGFLHGGLGGGAASLDGGTSSASPNAGLSPTPPEAPMQVAAGLVAPLPAGKGSLSLQLGSDRLQLFSYKPATYAGGRLLLVFHGVNRDAENYRDRAMDLGDRLGALVVAPLFDAEHFPSERYQRGGILKNGVAVPAADRTGALVNRLAEALAQREGRPGMPFALIGHSGGAQSLGRLAAFVPNQAHRIVLANPGSYTFPSTEASFPYGFGGLPAALQSEAVQKAYLAQPITVYLGAKDLVADENFDDSSAAMAQGASRYARGQAAFAAAQSLAQSRGWPFGWKLLVADGVGHSSNGMFHHPLCVEALGW